MDEKSLKKLAEIKYPQKNAIKIFGDKYELFIIKELCLS